MSLCKEGRFAGENNCIRGTVSVIEPLGDKVDVYFTIANQSQMVCRTDAHHLAGIRPLSPGSFFVAMDKCHLFEADAIGRNVSLAGR